MNMTTKQQILYQVLEKHKLTDKFNSIEKLLNSNDRLKILYNWIKTNYINQREFKTILSHILYIDLQKLELKEKLNNKHTCPFCHGSKIKPFINTWRAQTCTECDQDGKIKYETLLKLGIEDFA
jgi:DnaJ-class molecular chaperone